MKPWAASDLAVVFSTYPRQPAYMGETLASFASTDSRVASLSDIAVAVDASEVGSRPDVPGLERIRWLARTAEENARVAAFGIHQRATHNYWRALGISKPGARAILVCEDDLIFREGWISMLLQSLDELTARGKQEFILCPYSAHDHEHRALRRGTYYSSYVAHAFYGTQAVLYTAGEIAPVMEILWTKGILKKGEPYDLLMKRRAVKQQHLYVTRHSLVQHAGKVTTGLGRYHRSPSFKRAWPA